MGKSNGELSERKKKLWLKSNTCMISPSWYPLSRAVLMVATVKKENGNFFGDSCCMS